MFLPHQNKDYESSMIENNAEDLGRFITLKEAKPTHLIGHSYGTFVALTTPITIQRLFAV